MTPPRERWQDPDVARRYAGARFRDARAAGRDVRHVAALLARAPLGPSPRLLDAPCGAGRLRGVLETRGVWTGADASLAMLREGAGERVLADATRLPFRDASFDAVVSCRWLHHLDAERDLDAAAAELVRVARTCVVASFWDAGSWHAWRRRAGLRASRGRSAVPRARLALAFERAGARVVAWRHGLRFVSQQAFALALVEARR